jgi:hypothetical protein
MFECEMAGCSDSATHDIKFVSGEQFQICESCESYWKQMPRNIFEENSVESITEFARHADLTIYK